MDLDSGTQSLPRMHRRGRAEGAAEQLQRLPLTQCWLKYCDDKIEVRLPANTFHTGALQHTSNTQPLPDGKCLEGSHEILLAQADWALPGCQPGKTNEHIQAVHCNLLADRGRAIDAAERQVINTPDLSQETRPQQAQHGRRLQPCASSCRMAYAPNLHLSRISASAHNAS